MNFHAIVAACFSPGYLGRAIAVLEAKPEVAWIGVTLSREGVFLEMVARDTQQFGAYKERLFSELPGLISADVNVIWDVRKFHYRMLPIDVAIPGGGDLPSSAGDDADQMGPSAVAARARHTRSRRFGPSSRGRGSPHTVDSTTARSGDDSPHYADRAVGHTSIAIPARPTGQLQASRRPPRASVRPDRA